MHVQGIRPLVPFAEAHSGGIEKSSPVFQIAEPEQSQGIQERVQPIEDGGPPKKPRIDLSFYWILTPRPSAGEGEKEGSSRIYPLRSQATNVSSSKTLRYPE